MSSHKLGLAFGSALALFHTAWALLVASGSAQKVIDFIFWLHFINPPYQLDTFSIGRALGLILFTFVVGYIGGQILGWCLKKFGR